MSKADATRYNQYWNDIKQGLTVEQRYNSQKFGNINGLNTIINPNKQGGYIVGNEKYIEGRTIFD